MVKEGKAFLILIVDDQPENLRILTEALRDEFELAVATNGSEALEYVEKQIPDMILLDIMMPELDGHEVCLRLKSKAQTKDIPVIFISALNEIQNKTKGFELGAVDYITKPFEIVEVQSRVKMHLELKTSREILEEQNRKLGEVSRKLSKYLSPQIYESIFSGKKDVKLETQRKKLSVFFSDIQAFTELTDSMEPETLTYVLNDYLNEMSQIALFHGGTVDKFIGDAILVFFGDPETKGVKEDALACLLMSIEMRERIKYLRKKWDSDGIFRPLHIRMGISTGYCTVGNFGSENRLEYTIIGGQVNLANRLQSCAEPDQILISHETYSHVKDEIHCEKKEIIKVKGLAYPVQAYQVIDFKESYPKAESKLKEETKKFLVSLDFKKLSEADKRRLVDALQTTISEIKASS